MVKRKKGYLVEGHLVKRSFGKKAIWYKADLVHLSKKGQWKKDHGKRPL